MVCGSVRPARRARRSSSSELRIAGVDGVMEASERGFVAWCLVALPPGSYSTPHQKSRELSRAGLMPKEIAGPVRGPLRHPSGRRGCRRPGVARFRECRARAAATRKMRNHVSARRAAQTCSARPAGTEAPGSGGALSDAAAEPRWPRRLFRKWLAGWCARGSRPSRSELEAGSFGTVRVEGRSTARRRSRCRSIRWRVSIRGARASISCESQ